jgi:hypothetical protein
MDEIDRLQLIAQLSTEYCELNHGPDTRREDFSAVNYLALPVGYKKNDVQEISVRELVIPACYDCAEALLGNDWTLLYCLECAESRWIYRRLAKNKYRHHILWLKGCPDCSYEFGGLYFNDLQAVIGPTEFLAQSVSLYAS